MGGHQHALVIQSCGNLYLLKQKIMLMTFQNFTILKKRNDFLTFKIALTYNIKSAKKYFKHKNTFIHKFKQMAKNKSVALNLPCLLLRPMADYQW